MKKIYTLFLFMVAMSGGFAQSTSIFDGFIITNTNGAGNVYTSLATFNASNLGTFSMAQSLVIAGGQNKTVKCNGGNVTGGNIYYRVYLTSGTGGSFMALPMNFASDDSGAGAGCQNQTWQTTAGTTNILSGLANGNYTIEVYTDAPGSPSTAYYSNFSNNFKATFTIDNSVLGVSDVDHLKSRSRVADGKLYTDKKGKLEISVYEMGGKLVTTFSAKANGTAIDLDVPQSGNYILVISDSSSKETVKFKK